MLPLNDFLHLVSAGRMPTDGDGTDLPPAQPPISTDPFPPLRRTNG